MLLVDTSIWVDHLRKGDTRLIGILEQENVACHPYIIGELALGSLRNRGEILSLLKNLPGVAVASANEVLAFIEDKQLSGRGIGYVDCHLLASVFLAPGTKLWTRDKRLNEIASELEVAAT